MQQLKVPVESIYSMPNVRQWFVESTLYPFIGGDTVRREEMKVAGLQPSINMILPYATPKLSGCSREALVEFSACCDREFQGSFTGPGGGVPETVREEPDAVAPLRGSHPAALPG